MLVNEALERYAKHDVVLCYLTYIPEIVFLFSRYLIENCLWFIYIEQLKPILQTLFRTQQYPSLSVAKKQTNCWIRTTIQPFHFFDINQFDLRKKQKQIFEFLSGRD